MRIIEWLLKMITGELTPSEAKAFMALTWRGLVSFHMLYACGYLAMIGIPLAGFAQKTDVDTIQKAVVLQARLGLVREIRLQTDAMCTSADAGTRAALRNTIDRLREDYRAITSAEYPDPRC